MPAPLTIRILGAGVAGLAAAIALSNDGHQVELIDEHFMIPRVGTSIALFGSAQSVLDRIGVLDMVREVSATPRVGTLRSADGRILAAVPAGRAVLVARSDLVRILQNAIPRTVRLSTRTIGDVRPLREGTDLLIGADGVHSLVRRSGWPGSPRARSHGMTVLRGTVDIAPPEISETWGRGWLFGITPLAGSTSDGAQSSTGDCTTHGGTNWFACLPEHRTDSIAADLSHLRSTFGGRRAPIDAVLDAARPERTLVHGIHTIPFVHPVRENVALIGDAAHAMAPNLGHGANTALEDVGALAAVLRARNGGAGPSRSVGRALRAYALRRTVPDQVWRLASGAMLRVAMTQEHASLRDRLLSGLARYGTTGNEDRERE